MSNPLGMSVKSTNRFAAVDVPQFDNLAAAAAQQSMSALVENQESQALVPENLMSR
jgi:hypothetical protein